MRKVTVSISFYLLQIASVNAAIYLSFPSLFSTVITKSTLDGSRRGLQPFVILIILDSGLPKTYQTRFIFTFIV